MPRPKFSPDLARLVKQTTALAALTTAELIEQRNLCSVMIVERRKAAGKPRARKTAVPAGPALATAADSPVPVRKTRKPRGLPHDSTAGE